MKILDKLLMAATGIGAAGLVISYVRHRNDPKTYEYQCPWCKQIHLCGEEQWLLHVVEMRRGAQ